MIVRILALLACLLFFGCCNKDPVVFPVNPETPHFVGTVSNFRDAGDHCSFYISRESKGVIVFSVGTLGTDITAYHSCSALKEGQKIDIVQWGNKYYWGTGNSWLPFD